MADYRSRYHHQEEEGDQGIKSIVPENGPSGSQILAIVAALPVGGSLLLLAGLTLAGTLTGLAITTPIFILFSPIIVPAAMVILMAVLGFLTSGALGVTALSSLSWTTRSIRQLRGMLPQQLEHVKRRAQDTASQVGQKGRDAGQAGGNKGHVVTFDD